MFEKLRRSRIASLSLAVLAFIAIGYFSNAVTATNSRQATDRWLKENLARHPTNWPHRRASSQPAKYSLPWVVSVDYEWAVSGTGGEWGTRYYLSLLGLPIPVRNHIRVQS